MADLSGDVIEDTCCPVIRHNNDGKVANQRNCQQMQSNVHFEVAKECPESMRANLIFHRLSCRSQDDISHQTKDPQQS